MAADTDPASLNLTTLSRRCAQENERFFQRRPYDPAYCFELLRRAICDANGRAWELVYAQYQALVAGWVRRHNLFTAVDEEISYFVNRAFEKMWSVLTPEKCKDFPDLKSFLRYLQMCVHSVLVDFMRRKEQVMLSAQVSSEETAVPTSSAGPSLEAQIISRERRQELWEWLKGQFKNEKEEQLIYAMFSLGLKPREIAERFPHTFRDVREVYRVKENVMARLRRAPKLAEFLEDA